MSSRFPSSSQSAWGTSRRSQEVGWIVPALDSLEQISMLSLVNNHLKGAVPDAMASLEHLSHLELSYNDIRGAFPSALTSLAALELLFINNMNLTGSIPNAVASWEQMTSLDVSRNLFVGTIPNAVAFMSQLVQMALFFNEGLSGPIPIALALMSNLVKVQASNLQLSGCIPHAVESWKQMRHLDLAKNFLLSSVPCAATAWKEMQELRFSTNDLTGAVTPDALIALTRLGKLDLTRNMLRGSVSDGVQFWKDVRSVVLEQNQVSGSIPLAVGFWTMIKGLSFLRNALTGRMPDALMAGSELTFLRLSENKLKGSIPNALEAYARMERLHLHANGFWGTVPLAVESFSELKSLRVEYNNLSGTLPEGIFMLAQVYSVNFYHNSISGSLPGAMSIWKKKTFPRAFRGYSNRLSGTIGAAIFANLPEDFSVNDNYLVGTLAPMKTEGYFVTLAGNFLEGSVPHQMVADRLTFLDLAGKDGRPRGLWGPLPPSIRRMELRLLAASNQNLEGNVMTPAVSSLEALAVHDNHFKVFKSARFDNGSIVLLFNNALSCHLPRCNDQAIRISLSLLGNHVRGPVNLCPRWVTPIERDSLFLHSGTEACGYLLRILAASLFLAGTVGARLGGSGLARIKERWFGQTGPEAHVTLVFAFSRLLSSMAHGCLSRIIFLMYLLQWDLYACPRSLAVMSACLRGSRVTRLLVLAFWLDLTFLSPGVPAFAALRGVMPLSGPAGSHEVARRTLLRRSLQWLSWCSITLVLSSLSIVAQVGKSVPGLVGGGSHLPFFLNTGISLAQGFVSAIALPYLAKKLTAKKYSATAIANLLMNILFPAAVIVYLDTGCLGKWAPLWKPCKGGGSSQLRHDIIGVDWEVSYPAEENWYTFLATVERTHHIADGSHICSPARAVERTSISHCMELALLRLQDFWLEKLTVAGVLVPAGVIATKRWYFSLAKGVGKIVILVAYAIVASGQLPLMIPVLLLSMLTMTLVIAASSEARNLEVTSSIGHATSGIVMAQLLSMIVQLAFASGDALASGIVVAILIGQMVQRMRAACSLRARHGRRLLLDQDFD